MNKEKCEKITINSLKLCEEFNKNINNFVKEIKNIIADNYTEIYLKDFGQVEKYFLRNFIKRRIIKQLDVNYIIEGHNIIIKGEFKWEK